MENFDVIVIGAGPGGYVAAIRAAQNGLKVAICERDARLGGTCLLRGCIPTKSLLHAADLWASLAHAKDYGIHVGSSRLDFGGVQAARDKVVDQSARGVDYLMKKNKITLVAGHARLTATGAVEVEGKAGEARRQLRAKGIIIASGSVPRHIPGVKVDGKLVVTSDELLAVKEPPKSLTVLGGGAVGVEFASIFARFGSKVSLVEMQPTVLPIEDSDVGAEMQKLLAKRGIEVLTSTRLARIETTAKGVDAHLAPADPKAAANKVVHSEMLLVAIGRAPVTGDMGLDLAGVAVDEGGYVKIDGLMQTSRPGVYAIGDVVRTPWLAHVASAEGILAADHIAGREARPIDYLQTPSCTYSDPEVASVGLTERAARARGLDVKVGKFPFSAIAKARIAGKTEGFVKWVAQGRYNEIVGLHIIGEHATELVASGGVALRGELTLDDLAHTIYAHPTVSEGILEAAHAALGHAIQI